MAIFVLDVIWGGTSHLIHFRGEKSHAISWSAINIGATLLMLGVITFPFAPKPPVLSALAVTRTIFDYWNGRDFYFPIEPPAPPQSEETKDRSLAGDFKRDG